MNLSKSHPRHPGRHMRNQRGFTLIELMITVAVIAILAAVAYPSYTQQIRKGKRGQAKADIMDMTQQLERRFTTDRDYTKTTTLCGKTLQSPATGTVMYEIKPVCTASTYTITAVPKGPQVGDTCGTLTVSHTGARTPTTAGCW